MLSNFGAGEDSCESLGRSKQSILKEINPEYSLKGLRMKLKLKLQYFDHLMQRAYSLERTLMLGKTEGRRRMGQQRMRWLASFRLNEHEFEQTLEDSGRQRSLVCCRPWGRKESDMTERLNNNNQRWTQEIYIYCSIIYNIQDMDAS